MKQPEIFRRGQRIYARSPEGIEESIHPSQDPWEEARSIYLGPSQLENRLMKQVQQKKQSLVVWDVGLGCGYNAFSVFRAWKQIQSNLLPHEGKLNLISFENDLSVIETFMREFPSETSSEEKDLIHLLKDQKTVQREGFCWELHCGDFYQTLKTTFLEKPNFVYYDFFSPQFHGDLWSLHSFKQLFEQLEEGSELYTYSCSNLVRIHLLLAGFTVFQGPSSGQKASTTIALKGLKELRSDLDPLSEKWLDRISRSCYSSFLERVKTCRQFLGELSS